MQVSLKKIMYDLKKKFRGGVMDVFAPGRSDALLVFGEAHQGYSTFVAQMDANICSYLEVTESKKHSCFIF